MRRPLIALAVLALALPATAQTPAAGPPGSMDVRRVVAGSYSVDTNHSHVVWSVDHYGFSLLYGMVGAPTGTLVINPARPQDTKLDLTLDMKSITSTTEAFTRHLKTADLFNIEKFPTARFVSTGVRVRGTNVTVDGNLTLKGITKPITIAARFTGAGPHPRGGKLNMGFNGTAKLKRSDFNLGFGLPNVADEVNLVVTAAFQKAD